MMKKIVYLIFISLFSCIAIMSVSADDYADAVNKIAEEFNKLDVKIDYSECSGVGGKVTAKFNEVGFKGLKLTCSGSDNTLLILAYKEDEHTLTFARNGDSPGTINSDSKSIFVLMDNVLEAFLKVNGYNDMALPTTFGVSNYFSLTYNIIPEEQKMPFVRQGKVFDEIGSITYLKLSLEQDKIRDFIEENGDKYIRGLMNETPTLSSNNVTTSSISLNAKVDKTYDEYQASCYLYRSNSQDRDYSIVATVDNCLNGSVITDKDLEANTTYYYKIQFVGSNKMSSPIAMTTANTTIVDPKPDPDNPDQNVTLDNNTTIDNQTQNQNTVIDNQNGNTTLDDEKQNPNTGTFIPTVLISLFALGSVATLIYTNNKNKFKNY